MANPTPETRTGGQHDWQVTRVNEADGGTQNLFPESLIFFQGNCQKSRMSWKTFVLSFQYWQRIQN